MRLNNIIITLSFTVFGMSCAQQNKDKITYSYEVIVPNLNIPWGFAFLPDKSILITEKKGELIHFKKGVKNLVKGLPEIKVMGQGGLLDIELHPNYVNNGWIYFSYVSSSNSNNRGNTTIMRAKLNNNTLINHEILYKAKPDTNSGVHFGSRLEFDDSGYLYFSIGDRGNRDTNPQDITRDGGKIYRLNDDGTIPTNNPFTDNRNAKQAIFSYGHRNPQGMIKHPITGKIWIHEHGPKGGDEINIISKGENYGWPLASFGVNYSGTKFTDNTSLPNMTDPIHYWTPSIAPSGMCFITGEIYPNWKGKLLVGSLKFQYLNLCTLKDNKVIKEEKLLEDLGRVRSVKQDAEGYIYVGIENLGIVKIIPNK